MRRIALTALLSASGVSALAGTAGAAVGDIRNLSVDDSLTGTANTVEVSGTIRCQATIPYGLVVGVAQDANGEPAEGAFTYDENGDPLGEGAAEAVGAFGPNQGNEANSPCTQNLQSFEVVAQRNNGSSFFQDGSVGAGVFAGTSAENGSRGPGPFIADVGFTGRAAEFDRVEP